MKTFDSMSEVSPDEDNRWEAILRKNGYRPESSIDCIHYFADLHKAFTQSHPELEVEQFVARLLCLTNRATFLKSGFEEELKDFVRVVLIPLNFAQEDSEDFDDGEWHDYPGGAPFAVQDADIYGMRFRTFSSCDSAIYFFVSVLEDELECQKNSSTLSENIASTNSFCVSPVLNYIQTSDVVDCFQGNTFAQWLQDKGPSPEAIFKCYRQIALSTFADVLVDGASVAQIHSKQDPAFQIHTGDYPDDV